MAEQALEGIVRAEELMEPPHDGNVANLLARAVDRNPGTTAVEHAGETVTYGELGERVERAAAGLRGAGLGPGDRVCVYLPNGIPFCETLWACLRAGVVPSPINPEYRRREIEYQLEHSDAAAVVRDAERAEWADPVAEELGIEVFGVDPGGDRATLGELAGRGDPAIAEREDDDVAMQPYTSGTTGDPKGVLLTHGNFRVQIVDRVASYSASLLSVLDPHALIVFPMYHITGTVQMMGTLCSGRTVHVLRPDQWDPERVLETLDEHDVPSFGGVATMFFDLLEAYERNPEEYDLSTLRRAGQGGDKLPETVHEEFEETFDVAVSEGYGLTETTAGTHTIRGSTLGDKVGSVGQPMGHTESKVVDPDTGEELPVGEEGELLVRGPQVMAGYYDDPAATEAAFTDDGYFHTGDRAVRDEHNYHYIRGREKEMILTAGYNVYPAEVEEVLYDHPDVREAAVFGVPDERRGETVAAAVRPAGGADPTAEGIREYVLSEIAPYKHPRIVEVRDELPKTGSGKVRKVELREELADRSTD